MRISRRTLLPLLITAGSEGMTTTEMALHPQFADSTSYHNRSNRVSAVLRELALRGVAEHTGYSPSPLYLHQPVNRWRAIQPAADTYLGTPERVTGRERAEAARLQRAARKQHRAELAAGAAREYGRFTYPCVRARVCRELREQGLTLDEIGAVFGISRERARQILAGIKPRECWCPDCLERG